MAYRFRAVAVSAAVAAGLALATPLHAQKKYDEGASETEIRIGHTNPYSGNASAYGSSELRLYFIRTNIVVPTDVGIFGLADVGHDQDRRLLLERRGDGARQVDVLLADKLGKRRQRLFDVVERRQQWLRLFAAFA